MPRNTVPNPEAPTNYPETFKALAAEAEVYLNLAREVVERAFSLLDELAVENDVEWYTDEFRHLEIVYGFDALDVAINAVGCE